LGSHRPLRQNHPRHHPRRLPRGCRGSPGGPGRREPAATAATRPIPAPRPRTGSCATRRLRGT
jgi:hypothetical protein